MLQHSLYTNERLVQERWEALQQEVELQQRPPITRVRQRVQQLWVPVAVTLGAILVLILSL